MKFPYGISDFNAIISENYFYIDRTDRIPLIEQAGKQLLFLRPRRFGKSLLLNMLANYYDLAKAEQFESLFGTLKIGSNPTPKHNQYLVMTWDFSAVLPMGSTLELKSTLYKHINSWIAGFAATYQRWLPTAIELSDDGNVSLHNLLNVVRQTDYKLYLFIDEYDNFANEVMAAQVREEPRYAELVYGEGLLKSVFKNIKIATTGKGLDRVFITGVSPVVMADMSSGYNVATNIYHLSEFNDLCGFHDTEIQQTLQQIAEYCQMSETEWQTALTVMRQFYNGYCFNQRDKGMVYNPTLALHFFRHFAHYCEYPDDLLDYNLAMDRNRLNYIAKLPHGREVIEKALDESKPLTVPKLHDRFGVEDLLKSEPHEKELASLLYYLGVLTLDGTTPFGDLKLRIPNLVIRSLYVEKLQELLLPKVHDEDYHEAKQIFLSTGDLQPLCDFIEPRFAVFSNRDYRWNAEVAVKTAFLMFLFDDRLYIIDSEPELNRRYADLVMIVRPDARCYQILDHLLEFKFLSLHKDLNLTAEQIRAFSREQINALVPVQTAFAQATAQLQSYRSTLEKIYGDRLQLKMATVVALGFERLVWQKVDD
jgi:hypothetical protein